MLNDDYANFELCMKSRPHVVILGAGASCAAIPNGDKNGQKISAMKGFIDKLKMTDIIQSLNLSTSSNNLEDIYMEMDEREDCSNAKMELERRIEQYFSTFQIPDNPTVYDFLILSLRKKDFIATFNWDPLLVQAYDRCHKITKDLPELGFLHGTVAIGLCKKDKRAGQIGTQCSVCGKNFHRIPLLYPVKEKDYVSNPFIADSWRLLTAYLKTAYMITIFGYSAPSSDVAAVGMLKKAWGDVHQRNLEQIEIIDIQPKESVIQSWTDFIHTHHYQVIDNLFDSYIGKFPRRTCDVLFDNTMNVKWMYGNKGFKSNMSFDDIKNYLNFLLADEKKSGILNDPYIE